MIDTEEAVPIQYGVHSALLQLPDDTYNKKLFVNSKEATIVIGMSGDGSGTTPRKRQKQKNTEDSVTGESRYFTTDGRQEVQEVLQEAIQLGKAAEQHRNFCRGSSTGTSTGDSLETTAEF